MKQLVKFDRNLIALLSVLIGKHGVMLPPEAIRAIEIAKDYYDTKQYEYFVSGSKTFPAPDYISTYVRMTKSHVMGLSSIRTKE